MRRCCRTHHIGAAAGYILPEEQQVAHHMGLAHTLASVPETGDNLPGRNLLLRSATAETAHTAAC